MNCNSKNNKFGFTLIELLVVIAIIGILASIVLSALQASRQQADDAKREQEMRSVDVALELYGQKNAYDYSTLLPPDVTLPAGNHPHNSACDLFDSVSKELVAASYLPSVPVDPHDTDTGSNDTCYHMQTTNDSLDSANYGTILSVYAIEWQNYIGVTANRQVGFVVSQTGDPEDVAHLSCNTFSFPIFNAADSSDYCDASMTQTSDLLLGVSAGK